MVYDRVPQRLKAPAHALRGEVNVAAKLHTDARDAVLQRVAYVGSRLGEALGGEISREGWSSATQRVASLEILVAVRSICLPIAAVSMTPPGPMIEPAPGHALEHTASATTILRPRCAHTDGDPDLVTDMVSNPTVTACNPLGPRLPRAAAASICDLE